MHIYNVDNDNNGNNGNNFGLQRILLKISPLIFSNILIHNKINPTALVKDPYAIK